jgi:hypothetical protein
MKFHSLSFYLLFLTSVEDHGLGAIHEDPLLAPPLDSSSQYLALDVTALVHELLGTHSMVGSRHALLNNRTLIQIRSDKVCGSSNNLDTALESLVVRLGALERRQERVVDVDYLAGHDLAQLWRQNLHVAGQDDELDLVLGDEVEDLRLLLLLGVFGDGQVVELDAVALGERLELGVVGNYDGDFDAELLRLVAEEQVVQAMADLGHHDQDARLLGHGVNFVVHLQVFGQVCEGRLEGVCVLCMAEVDSHEEALGDRVRELLQVEDVEVLLGQESGDIVHDAGLVRAGQREDVVVDHLLLGQGCESGSSSA